MKQRLQILHNFTQRIQIRTLLQRMSLPNVSLQTFNIPSNVQKLLAATIVIIALMAAIAFSNNSQLLGLNFTQADLITNQSTKSSKLQLQEPTSVVYLNKEFTFGVGDSQNNRVGEFSYTIDQAQLQDEIIIKGQKAKTIAGRTFLIIQVKLVNNQSKNITVNTRDYIRLSVNGSDEKLAPDIHNDPLELLAESVRYTRIGFHVNESDKDFTLWVGEIGGDKTPIEIHLN